MNLLIFAPSYSPKTGGVEKHIRAVVKCLVERGFTIKIAVRWDEKIPQRQIVDGVEVRRLPKTMSSLYLFVWALKNPNFFWKLDAIHSHDIYPRLFRKLLPQIRWVHTFHGYEGFPINPAAIISRKVIRNEVPICIGVGLFIEKWYETKCDYIIYGAVDNADLPKTKLPAIWDIVYIGRLEKDTGFEDYLKGLAIISIKHKTARLVVLGDGKLMGWACEFVAQNNLHVQFMGMIGNVEDYLAKSSSAFASGYLGIIEAGLYELPIIAHYGNPLKKDYLEMHPMAKELFIVSSPEAVAAAYDETLLPDAKNKVARLNLWSQHQSWDKIVDIYETSYRAEKDFA